MKEMSGKDQLTQMALTQPHPMAFVDESLRVEVGQETSQVTLGFNTPQGTVLPFVTLVMSTSFLRSLSNDISRKLPKTK